MTVWTTAVSAEDDGTQRLSACDGACSCSSCWSSAAKLAGKRSKKNTVDSQRDEREI